MVFADSSMKNTTAADAFPCAGIKSAVVVFSFPGAATGRRPG
ncbi:hypothetical protein CCHOA_00535 [Corynebacterium choanae]|uniref:Uncharacterized protein n=1 Tax=Corynebacterium choanae TaxID=1862358 RepID=A0A3G6J3N2_9CORY|nr:hypothetical protein CCHOA_00535 [Corynebacterium choanae]